MLHLLNQWPAFRHYLEDIEAGWHENSVVDKCKLISFDKVYLNNYIADKNLDKEKSELFNIIFNWDLDKKGDLGLVISWQQEHVN